ncbi:unnamed protein product [Nippostrongylus brasiliensis]|uniref:DUF725 domain-containing protein n=1 Tax=Nippostrongylus brasiliensis TaxID=27835 RepID=A0A0N4YSX4_NIPBR|nr:unnamed protein product [Nippostrongylus brasiliensis]
MSNARLFFAVTGALLISNADQIEPSYPPDCWNKGKDAKACARTVENQAERAEILLSDIAVELTNCREAIEKLEHARADFEAFLKEPTLEKLFEALEFLLVAYEKAEICCKDDVGRCPSVLFHNGNSIECTIAAIYNQLNDAEKQTVLDYRIQYPDDENPTEEEHAKNAYDSGRNFLNSLLGGEETNLENH